MVYVDEYGIMHGADNSFLALLKRIFTHPLGITFALVPLAILVGIFFLIKYKSSNKKILIVYSIIALIAYIFYFFFLRNMFSMF